MAESLTQDLGAEDPCLRARGQNRALLENEHMGHGWSAEEIYLQHERQISLAQIHAALAYYYDNQAQIDAQVAQEDALIARIRAHSPEPPLVQRMRSEGRLR